MALIAAEALSHSGRYGEAASGLESVSTAILARGPQEWRDYPAVLLLQLQVEAGLRPATLDDESRAAIARTSCGFSGTRTRSDPARARDSREAPVDNKTLASVLADYDELWERAKDTLGSLNRVNTAVHAAEPP
jgi:hypothetical protein